MFLAFFFVCHDGNLHLICLQVLLGRSDVSGWGAFLKVFTKLMIQFVSSSKKRNDLTCLDVFFPNAIWLNSRIAFVSMNTLESIPESWFLTGKQISEERYMTVKIHLFSLIWMIRQDFTTINFCWRRVFLHCITHITCKMNLVCSLFLMLIERVINWSLQTTLLFQIVTRRYSVLPTLMFHIAFWAFMCFWRRLQSFSA